MGEVAEGVLLPFAIAYAGCLRVGIFGNLVEVAAELSGESKLVAIPGVVGQRGECAVACNLIVQVLERRRLQAVIAAIAIQAGVIREPFGVVAEAQLIVGLVIAAVAGDEFSR